MVILTKKSIRILIEESIEAKQSLLDAIEEIRQVAYVVSQALQQGKKVLIAGNGGSAADAQHFAAELIGRFKMKRKALPCIALTTDTSILTAWSNDYGFETVFERQIEGLGKEGDVFIGLSTSGNSENIIRAIEKAKKLGMRIISILGSGGGKAKGLGNVEIIVRSDDTPRIQECHITILHIIAELVEKELK